MSTWPTVTPRVGRGSGYAAFALFMGCAPTSATEASERGSRFVDDPSIELPARLSELEVFTDLEGLVAIDAAQVYTPDWPLWSNGSDKRRWLLLPRGAQIDNSTLPWSFPAGSLLLKAFSYPGQPVEVRVMRRRADSTGWDFSSYLWDGDTADARQSNPKAATPVEVELPSERFEHNVPSVLECRACHEASKGPVLGFNPLQLGPQLGELWDRGLLQHEDETEASPLARDALTREVLGYFLGNCVHCHNAWPDAPDPTFDLSPAVALTNLVGEPTEGNASAVGIRVVAGQPSASVLFQAVSGETEDPEVKAMPPLGVDRLDRAAVELLREWILSLQP